MSGLAWRVVAVLMGALTVLCVVAAAACVLLTIWTRDQSVAGRWLATTAVPTFAAIGFGWVCAEAEDRAIRGGAR